LREDAGAWLGGAAPPFYWQEIIVKVTISYAQL
jgi:hypothetical protein